MERAALYLRSSKDRHDISIDAQREALQKLARQLDLAIAEEFSDVVESGKDEDRAGFQRLLSAVRNPARGWAVLLLLDTSRLSRRRRISVLFEEVECAPRGIRVVYKSLPQDMDEATEVIVKSNFQAIDQWHSIVSRQKGLAGMAQNVAAGFRAGGRAPFGYRLQREPTGAMRDGAPVLKSKLEPSEDATIAREYLRARADGVPRALAARTAGVKLGKSSLCGMEWNALTYAGHTVWNVHAPREGAIAIGGSKRRPRAEWKVRRDTHVALITEAQAEAILRSLAQYSVKRPRRRTDGYLLSGLLRTPEGRPWFSEAAGNAYRTKGRYVPREPLERQIVAKVMGDLTAPRFVDAIVAAAKREGTSGEQARHGRALAERLKELTERISRMMDMAAEMLTPGPALRRIEGLELERADAARALDQWHDEQAKYAALAAVTPGSVRAALNGMAESLRDQECDQMRFVLSTLVSRIDLCPKTFGCVVHYRIQPSTHRRSGVGSIRSAYPWGRQPNAADLPLVHLAMPLILSGIRVPRDRQSKPLKSGGS